MTAAGLQPYRRWRQALFWVSVTLGVLVVLAVAAVAGLGASVVAASGPDVGAASGPDGGAGAGAGPALSAHPGSGGCLPGTAGSSTDVTATASAAASRTAPWATDGAGATIRYDATNMTDGTPSTAWRAPGDAADVSIVLTLPQRVRLCAVGLIPGYAKQDPATGADRFTQNRRVARAQWLFEDGTSIDQTFQDTARMQTIAVDVETTRVVLRLVATIPGSPDFDFTAVSDVQLVVAA